MRTENEINHDTQVIFYEASCGPVRIRLGDLLQDLKRKWGSVEFGKAFGTEDFDEAAHDIIGAVDMNGFFHDYRCPCQFIILWKYSVEAIMKAAVVDGEVLE